MRASVTAPPVDGAANEALIRLIAAQCGVPKSCVTITAGAGARIKSLRIDADEADLTWATG